MFRRTLFFIVAGVHAAGPTHMRKPAIEVLQTDSTASSQHRERILKKQDPIDPNLPNGLKWVPPSKHDTVAAAGYTRFVFLADIHSWTSEVYVPNGDVLILAGDIVNHNLHGGVDEIKRFADWFGALPHRDKFVVAGNHDGILDRHYIEHHQSDHESHFEKYTVPQHEEALEILRSATTFKYLQNEQAIAANYKIYATPYSTGKPYSAFNQTSLLDDMPSDIDILVSHGPPLHELDEAYTKPEGIGCPILGQLVRKIKPKLHVFGHIHEANGVEHHDGVSYINCAVVGNKQFPSELYMLEMLKNGIDDKMYFLENTPHVVDCPTRTSL